MTDKTPIDSELYQHLCELLGCINNTYICMSDAADGLHKAAMAMASAHTAQANMASTMSRLLDRLQPVDNHNPTEE